MMNSYANTEKMNDDEFLCKHTQSAEFTSINPSAISSSDILSDKGREHGQSPDSQETITDELSSSETHATRISKNLHPDDLHASKGFSEVQDLLVSGRYLESGESDYHSSESESTNSPTNLKINRQYSREKGQDLFQIQTMMIVLRRIWYGWTNMIRRPNLFRKLLFQKIF